MISERQKLVLKTIVEEYVSTNEPVGSRTLSRLEWFNASPATLRNDMADLEDLGYLVKTHSSSGRIPSEKGYRFYVEEMMKKEQESNLEFPMIDDIFRRQDISREEAINQSMDLVSNLTNYTSIVLGQSAYNSRIRKLEFLALQDHFAIILMITDLGHVESKKILIPDGLSVKEIERVIAVLDEILHNCLVCDIETKLKEEITNEDVRDFILYREDLVNAFASAFADMAKDKYHVQGQSKMLLQPEFQDVEKLKEIYEAIEQREILKVVKYDETGITVRIGQENEIKALQDCTVITVPYESSSGERGAISVFGPTRMEYNKIIPLLEYIAKNIKNIV